MADCGLAVSLERPTQDVKRALKGGIDPLRVARVKVPELVDQFVTPTDQLYSTDHHAEIKARSISCRARGGAVKGVSGGHNSVGGRSGPRVVYFHLVRGAQATREDFLSHEARGIPPRRPDARSTDLNRGVSLVDSLERAKRLHYLFPRLGTYAAKLEIPPGVRIETTLWEGHYTVWADPGDLLAWVVEIVSLA